MSETLSNTINSYIGDLQQTVGEKLGNPEMAAGGAAVKSQANAAQRATDAQNQSQAWGHTVEGRAQQKVGSLTGDTTMQAKGTANQVLGDVQRKILDDDGFIQ
ncbi:hypothetical protein BGX26_005801 [Mortierella sp. AD094]|nr:hypothetical protein BGX26_005801 [Mortierella sp. AD094]